MILQKTLNQYVHAYTLWRVLLSMGALGAIAPTVFESVGASTHGF